MINNLLESLCVPPPDISLEDVRAVALTDFDLEGEISELGGERDRNFRITSDQHDVLIKVANPGEQDDILDMQCQALLHIENSDSELPTPKIIQPRSCGLWATLNTDSGETFRVRAFRYLPGEPIGQGCDDSGLMFNIGNTVARLNQALCGFFHASARHLLAWNVQCFDQLEGLRKHVKNKQELDLIDAALQQFNQMVKPNLIRCPHQIIHNDVSFHNTVVESKGSATISGIFDFGDMIYGPVIQDLANAAAEIPAGGQSPLNGCADIVAGFNALRPLSDIEFSLLPTMITCRLALGLLISHWSDAEVSWQDQRDHLDGWHEKSAQSLELLLGQSQNDIENLLRASCGNNLGENYLISNNTKSTNQLLMQRNQYLANADYIAYDEPIHVISGRGVWLTDADGKQYLDAYNNVPHAGHCHPEIVAATAKQIATLNTNTRYLYHSISEYCERITNTLPDGLDSCFFVSSGSEANDLAWRLATAWTGHSGGMILDNAYHGITEAAFAFSPAETNKPTPDHIQTIPGPDDYRGQWSRDNNSRGVHYAELAHQGIYELRERGHKLAAFILDNIMSSSGIFPPPPGYLETLYQIVHKAGGLNIADEVQSGFGRTGKQMWGFQHGNVIPDIVTFGKPIAGGYPMGLVITRREIARYFQQQADFFSTTGGNPVACAAALAMLDVIDKQNLIENADRIGTQLQTELIELGNRFAIIGDVRGSGLFIGVELVIDRASKAPATQETRVIVNALRNAGVLVGIDGLFSNVIKIRPPMVFNEDHVQVLINALETVLSNLDK